MSSISLGPIIGTFVALIITPYFCLKFGWESIFYICGSLGSKKKKSKFLKNNFNEKKKKKK